MMFAECRMEVYETARTMWVEEGTGRRNIDRANIVSRVRESFQQVQQQLYAAYELITWRIQYKVSEWRNGLIMYRPYWVI